MEGRGGQLTLAEAIEAIKAKLDVDASLKGKAAVQAAREALFDRGTLREQVLLLCRELDISFVDGAAASSSGGNAAASSPSSEQSSTASCEECVRLREECAKLKSDNWALREAAAPPVPQPQQHATPTRGLAGAGVAISFNSPRISELRVTARAALAEGRYPEAMAACTEAVKLAPDDVGLRLQRARAQAELGEYVGALDDATLCTNAEPDMWRAWKIQAEAHMQLLHFEQAAAAYQLAQQTVPPAYQHAQSTELAKGYNNAILMKHQLANQAVRSTPVKDEQVTAATRKRRSSTIAHSGPGPKVMNEIRKMQTDIGDGSAVFDMSIENPLRVGMVDTPRDPTIDQVDVYDSLTKRCGIRRTYRICEPCRPSSVPGEYGIVGGFERSEMSAGQEATGVELLATAAGDVYVRLDRQLLPDSDHMHAVQGSMTFELPAFDETARDFTRAYVAGSNDMLFLSPEIGMHEPLSIPCSISATGDVNQAVTEQAVDQFGEFLATSIRAIGDQSKEPGTARIGPPSAALIQRIIANLTVTPGMQCLLDNGLSPAIFQNKYIVVIASGQIRVITYGFVGEPVTGDRPDRKATPYCLVIISDDLAQIAPDVSLSGVYAVRSTLHVDIDAVITEDRQKLHACIKSGDWPALLLSHGLGWLQVAYPRSDGSIDREELDHGPLPCLEVFPLALNCESGLPVPLQDEQPKAYLKEVKLRMLGVSGSLSSGSVTLTDQRLIWVPDKVRRRRRSSVTLSMSHADVGPLSLPLVRLGNITFNSRRVSFCCRPLDMSKASGQYSWSVGGNEIQIEMGRQSVRTEAFYWLLRRTVDLKLRFEASFEPRFVAEDLLAEQCGAAIRSDNAGAIARQWKHAAEEAEASALHQSSMTPSQIDVGEQLLGEARHAIIELQRDICTSHRHGFRKIFKATPGLYRPSRAPPILRLGYVKLLNVAPQIGPAQAARPIVLGVLLLTSQTLEVYEELIDAESPFDHVATYSLRDEGEGPTIVGVSMKRHPSTMQQSELLHLQLAAPSDTPVWFDASAEALRGWQSSIAQACKDLGADAGSDASATQGATVEDEDGEEEDSNRNVDCIVGQQVNMWLQSTLIGPYLTLLKRFAEASCELPISDVDDAMARAKSKSQASDVFGIPKADRDESDNPWDESIAALDRMREANQLPCELIRHMEACHEAIYSTHRRRAQAGHDLGPQSFLAILTYVLCKSSTTNLPTLIELMRQFAATQTEQAEVASTVCALHNLLKQDFNEKINSQIRDDMVEFQRANGAATLGAWATASEWAKDTGGERDATGAPIRALDGVWNRLWTEATRMQSRPTAPSKADGLQRTTSGEELLVRFEREWDRRQASRHTRLESGLTDLVERRSEFELEPEPEPEFKLEPEFEPEPTASVASPNRGKILVEILWASGLIAADLTGLSDPYVVAQLGKASKTSTTRNSTLEPIFNEMLELILPETDPKILVLEIFDRNSVRTDAFLGETQLDLHELFAGTDGRWSAATHQIQMPLRDPNGRGSKSTEREVRSRIAAGNIQPHGVLEFKLVFVPTH